MKPIIHARNGKRPAERFPHHELSSAGPITFLLAMALIFLFSLALATLFTGTLVLGLPVALIWTGGCARTWFRTRKPARDDPDHDPDLAQGELL